ncbi:MAG: hypothetical protein ACTSRU_07310 [Candidatus Hodarchaeales archaeon]
MKDMVIAVLFMVIGSMCFETLNSYGIKGTDGSLLSIATFIIITSFLTVTFYFFLLGGMSMGYQAFSNDAWLLLTIQIFISYGSKLLTRYVIFKQPMGMGQLVGLVLIFMGTVVSKVWK